MLKRFNIKQNETKISQNNKIKKKTQKKKLTFRNHQFPPRQHFETHENTKKRTRKSKRRKHKFGAITIIEIRRRGMPE